MNLRDHISWQTRQTTPVACGDATLTFEARALIIRFARGGFVWNAPTAALVERVGSVQRIPIVDVTRQAVWTFTAISVFFGFLAFVFGSSKKRTGKRRKS